MTGIFGGPELQTPPTPPTPPPIPRETDPAIAEAKRRAKEAASLAGGRGSTIVTSAQGLTGGAVSSAGKTLLGN